MTETIVDYRVATATTPTSKQIVCCGQCGALIGTNENGVLIVGGLRAYIVKDAECAVCGKPFYWQWPFRRVRQPR